MKIFWIDSMKLVSNVETNREKLKKLKKIKQISKKLLTFEEAYSRINIVLSETEQYKCDSGSVGRVRPCQGRGRGFEPRLSLS